MSRPNKPSPTLCVGNPSFSPGAVLDDVAAQEQARQLLSRDDFAGASRALLGLPDPDGYTYHATASVRLDEAQHAVGLGAAHGLHAWYRADDGSPPNPEEEKEKWIDGAEADRGEAFFHPKLDPPRLADIEGYVAVFSPSTVSESALVNLATNARKASIRADVAAHMGAKRFVHPKLAAKLTVAKSKKPPSANPYFDFWAWSCRNLEWCGPCAASERAATSHHVLPVLMHHFGCVAPSHEALEVLRRLAGDNRAVVDMGSGNGYWTLMLRRYSLEVHAVDSKQSEWRVNWIDDTVVTDGIRWLRSHNGGRDMMMLLVYPVVGRPEGVFTRGLVEAFSGNLLAVVGTQNGNGYTGFNSMTMDQYMAREQPGWTRLVQIPLPSFAGKDEALFVYGRGGDAPG